MIDWGQGRYEDTAVSLEPAAVAIVARAALRPGERVLDVGCGTGNAALAAARAGAVVSAVDPSERLVEVARERLAPVASDATVVRAEAEALPFADGSFDVVLSVFAVIFAPDAARAVTELLRVVRPGGRVLVSAWLPEGPIDRMMGVLGRAIAGVMGPPPPRFAWHEPTAVAELAAPHGATVTSYDAELTISAPSAEEYFELQERTHPMSVAMRPVLERAPDIASVREEALAALRDGNENATAFRVTSRYRVLELAKRP